MAPNHHPQRLKCAMEDTAIMLVSSFPLRWGPSAGLPIAILFPSWHRPYLMAIEVRLPQSANITLIPSNHAASSTAKLPPHWYLHSYHLRDLPLKISSGSKLPRISVFRECPSFDPHTSLLTLSASFWDWTLDNTKQGLPSQITDENIVIHLPGTQQTIKNPLATFHFGGTLPRGFDNI
ncbi:hypothetical protein PILCRDRAFT_252296 [Piloderma croceum F 1598]|uniref:Tyrosinase copper-binding domain-containing protein n=1 Tax=Piloderma croceum (strain F 1598) TaxID=765440 RepID=A0A0C3FV27_PILCF|nr:hypothetical protein PILCRDRAFT_252296 [Piloderma croceum F 1598]